MSVLKTLRRAGFPPEKTAEIVLGPLFGENERTRALEAWHDRFDLMIRLNGWRPLDERLAHAIDHADKMAMYDGDEQILAEEVRSDVWTRILHQR